MGSGAAPRGVTQCPKKRRDGRENGGLTLNDLQEDVLWRMQGLDQHDGPADDQRQEDANRQHETVEHRQQQGESVERHRIEHDPATLDIVQQVAVRQHGPFRMSRRAGSVNQDGQVRLGAWDRLQTAPHLASRQGDVLNPDDVQCRAQRGELCQDLRLRAVRDQHVDSCVGNDVMDLLRLEKIVDGRDHAACHEHAEQGRDELRAIPEPQADTVARADAMLRL